MTIYRKTIAAKFLNQILKNQDPALNNTTHQYALFGVGAEANLLAGVYTDELSGNGYARVTGFNAFPLASATTQAVSNMREIRFPNPTGVWAKAKYLAVFNSNSTQLLYFTPIKNAPVAKVGEPVVFAIDSVVWYLDEKVTPVNNVTVESFTTSTTWTAPANITSATMLIAAGGGGGGAGSGGGGGGAGGFKSNIDLTANIVSGQTYTITVGTGGAARYNGTNSSAFGYTMIGGGAGGYDHNNQVGSGGSGGGAAEGSNQSGGGAGTAGQGYEGGDSNYNTANGATGGGGGGAAGPGGHSGVTIGGAGGLGVFDNITGSVVYYAAGGDGGSSVGGAGYSQSTPGSGGGGGGGSAGPTAGQNGIVIIRYTTA